MAACIPARKVCTFVESKFLKALHTHLGCIPESGLQVPSYFERPIVMLRLSLLGSMHFPLLVPAETPSL